MATSKPRQIISSELQIIPDPGMKGESILLARDPKSKGLGLYASFDGGVNWQAMIPAPRKKIHRKGCVLTIVDDEGNADWVVPDFPRINAAAVPREYVHFNLVGDIYAGATFGFYKVPSGRSVYLRELQISVQDTADQNIKVDLVNGSNVTQGLVAALASGDRDVAVNLDAPLLMKSGTVWRVKIVQSGTTNSPGQNITVRAGIEFIK